MQSNVSNLFFKRSIEKPIQYRFKEYNERSKNIDRLTSAIKLVRDFVASIHSQPEEDRYHTKEELQSVLLTANTVEEWMNEQIEAQKKQNETQDPIITTAKVLEKKKLLDDEFVKLLAKKKPKTKKESPPKNKTDEESKEEEEKSSEEHKHDEL